MSTTFSQTRYYSYMCILTYNIRYFRSLMDTLVIVKRSMKSQPLMLHPQTREMKDVKFVKPQYHPLSLNVHTASPTPQKVPLYVAVSIYMFFLQKQYKIKIVQLLFLMPTSIENFTSRFQTTKIFPDRKSLETSIKCLLIQRWLIPQIVVRWFPPFPETTFRLLMSTVVPYKKSCHPFR